MEPKSWSPSLIPEADKELRAFLEEYEATGGRMYQDRDRPGTKVVQAGSLAPLRPAYYGRKGTTTLSKARSSRCMSQTQLAIWTGTTRRTISAIENGREPSVFLAIAIAQALDMKVEDIFHLPHLTPVPPSRY